MAERRSGSGEPPARGRPARRIADSGAGTKGLPAPGPVAGAEPAAPVPPGSLRVVPVAFDSMGVRSMCTLVETGAHRILIDPGACLAKTRFGLPAAVAEMDALTSVAERIDAVAEKADTIVVSHFHSDHYGPNSNFYTGKLVIVKHPQENICRSQRLDQAPFFVNRLRSMTKKLEYGDGRTFKLSDATIEMSPAVPHGTRRTRRGFVVMTCIRTKSECVVHTSDVQGPTEEATARWIVERDPTVLVVGGPRAYVAGKLKEGELEAAERSLGTLLAAPRLRTLILDHHAVREEGFRKTLGAVWKDRRVVTAAQFLGQGENLLEARRKELWTETFLDEAPSA